MEEDAKPYLLSEASRLTGLSVDAIRKRIARNKARETGKWRAVKSNADGQWRVWLTAEDIQADREGQSMDATGQELDILPDNSRTIRDLEREIATLQEALARERDRVTDYLEARLTLQSKLATAEQEREAAKVAAAMAEGELKGTKDALALAREQLAEARRPFWRRWFG